MEKEKVEIMIGNVDRASWCQEKINTQMNTVAKAIEDFGKIIKKYNIPMDTMIEDFESDLNMISYDGTKLLLTLNGYPSSFIPMDTIKSTEEMKIMHEDYQLYSITKVDESSRTIRNNNIKIFKNIIYKMNLEEKSNRTDLYDFHINITSILS